jgi:ammonia channel protein AmtB
MTSRPRSSKKVSDATACRGYRSPAGWGTSYPALLLGAVLLCLPWALPAQDDATEDLVGETETVSESEPDPAMALATTLQRLDGLDQGIQNLKQQIEANRDSVAVEAERLNAELKRMDPIAERLDSLAQMLEQAQAMLEKHETRLEDNSVKLFKTLMGIRDTEQALDAIKTQLDDLERLVRRAPTPAQRASAVATDEANSEAQTAATDPEGGGPPVIGLLGILSAAAILLYPVGGARGSEGPSDRADGSLRLPSAVTPLLTIGGCVLGYLVLGAGILNGQSQSGVLGAPFEILSQLWRLSPDQSSPELASMLVVQLPLLVAIALVVTSAVARRISEFGALLVGLIFGAFLLPLFGHWGGFPGLAEDAVGGGWLAALGFADPGGVVATALVGGGAALGIRLLQQRGGEPSGERLRSDAPDPRVIAVLLLWIGWLASHTSALQPRDGATLLALASWASALGALLTAALFSALFYAGQGRFQGLPAALAAGAIAAPALAEVNLAAALLFGVAVGLLHSLLARALAADDGTGELAAAFTVAGLAAALAPVLAGPEGVLFSPVAEALPVQLLGAGVAILLGVGGGLLLGLVVRLVPADKHPGGR